MHRLLRGHPAHLRERRGGEEDGGIQDSLPKGRPGPGGTRLHRGSLLRVHEAGVARGHLRRDVQGVPEGQSLGVRKL